MSSLLLQRHKFPDLVRVIDHIIEDNMPNKWIISIGSIHNTGDSGYEISGEVVLLTSE